MYYFVVIASNSFVHHLYTHQSYLVLHLYLVVVAAVILVKAMIEIVIVVVVDILVEEFLVGFEIEHPIVILFAIDDGIAENLVNVSEFVVGYVIEIEIEIVIVNLVVLVKLTAVDEIKIGIAVIVALMVVVFVVLVKPLETVADVIIVFFAEY